MEEPERVLQTLKGEKWRMEERSGLERWIWEPHGETVLVEDVGLNQLDGGEFVEMENKTAEGKLAGAGVGVWRAEFCSRKNMMIQRKSKERDGKKPEGGQSSLKGEGTSSRQRWSSIKVENMFKKQGSEGDH